MPVRVLLVEGDDSTRRIIAAHLRKCSYRVAATSDGLKAWNTLKQKPQTIDLVLSEVDLPSISGFGLLTMIMDHNTFKNIPVIMMSSHDSTSMVFKCMLKGAADFLTKPLHKNELRNLWQHVWRRQVVSEQDDIHKIQVNCDAKHKLTAHSGVMLKALVQAQMLKLRVLKWSLISKSYMLDDGKNIQFDNAPFANENIDDTQNECLDPNSITNGTNGWQCHHDITSKDLVDLIQVIENQPQGVFQSGDSTTVQSGFSDIAVHDVGVMCKSNPKPNLELLLKRFEGIFPEKPDCDGSNTWYHSSSSAFSLYNSRTAIPTLLIQKNSGSRSSGQNCTEPLLNYKDSSENMEATKSPVVEPPVQCTPLRVIPLPLPVGSMPLCSGVPGGTGCTSTTNTLSPMTVSLTDQGKLTCEGTKPINCSMSQREMALNKFRLKRKDRCFEKKVRYHSRKLLAEQRPRVKGQFVRQAK
ncbi:hypothetical protein OPV22_018052 [Ensete ventricosum]|uniref:Uncharacterized protein n=1 Tax=Ensete ventricosum TaxID=4639 RepID=A0AAV8QTG2_ENSVE|nr:hypothetical protein OPV22_018052 [Ensete ventricosum]